MPTDTAATARLALAAAVSATAAVAAYRLATFRRRPRERWLYEPGSLTHYLAGVLERHSQRRRRPVRVYCDGYRPGQRLEAGGF